MSTGDLRCDQLQTVSRRWLGECISLILSDSISSRVRAQPLSHPIPSPPGQTSQIFLVSGEINMLIGIISDAHDSVQGVRDALRVFSEPDPFRRGHDRLRLLLCL